MARLRKEKGLPLFLDIGSNAIKWMQVKEIKQKPEIAKLGITKLPVGSIRDGFISDDKAIIQTIAGILEENKLKEKSCVTALSGLQVVARLVKLPPMEEKEVKMAIQYQAENYIPYPADQVTMDIHLLGEVMEGESRKVVALLVAAQKETVYSLVEVLAEAGLRVRELEMAPFVLLRSVIENQPEMKEKHILSVHVGASSSVLAVISERNLRFCRIVPIAGNHLSRALVNTLRLEFSEAERTKKKMGAAFVEDGKEGKDVFMVKQLKNMMAPVLTGLLNEIQRSIAYYESKYRRATIEKILLSGGTAKLKGLAAYFEKELGVPVEEPDPFSLLHIRADVSQEYLKAVAPLFSVCAGLVLREAEHFFSEEEFHPVGVDASFEFGSSRQAGI